MGETDPPALWQINTPLIRIKKKEVEANSLEEAKSKMINLPVDSDYRNRLLNNIEKNVIRDLNEIVNQIYYNINLFKTNTIQHNELI